MAFNFLQHAQHLLMFCTGCPEFVIFVRVHLAYICLFSSTLWDGVALKLFLFHRICVEGQVIFQDNYK